MPSGGQNKKPAKLKVIQGTARIKKKQQVSGTNEKIQSAPPDWLPKYAKYFWNEYLAKVEEIVQLEGVDQAAFENLALLYSMIREAQEILNKTSLMVKGARGVEKVKNPILSVLSQARKDFRLYAQEFGLTPASRGRMDISEFEVDDENAIMKKLYEER